MNKKNKKQLRQEAINAEIKRRERDRASRSPLNRDQMLRLVEYVGKSIIDGGHDHNFKYIAEWARQNSIDFEKLTSFLNSERIKDDWDLSVSCDPYKLFGSTADRLAWMPLEKDELEDLLDWLDEAVSEKGCAHNYSLAREWLSTKSVDTSTTLMALMAKGGGCDCEILLNVEEEYIYP